MASLEDDERKFKRRLAKTTLDDVDVGGEVWEGDYLERIQRVALIASVMGMGACKTITEFVDMIEHEDLALIDTLVFAIVAQQRRMLGDTGDDEPQKAPSKPKDANRKQYTRRQDVYHAQAGDASLVAMLSDHGYDAAKIKEISEKAKGRQIKLPKTDFSGIVNEDLSKMSPEEFSAKLKEMNQYAKQAPNFKIAMRKWKKWDSYLRSKPK